MTKFRVNVTQTFEIELDPAKFDEAFMAEFREHFYPFETLSEHARHLAQLATRECYAFTPECFIEGYGQVKEAGIGVVFVEAQEEAEEVPA